MKIRPQVTRAVRAVTLAVGLVLSGFLVSCQTVNQNIPEGSSPEVYFQRAQDATDQLRYPEALAIYRQFLSVAPEGAVEQVMSARFEIALLQYKQGETAAAIAGWKQILQDYQDVSKSAGAPAWVKVLTQKKLDEVSPAGSVKN